MSFKFIGSVTDQSYIDACDENPNEFYKDFKVYKYGDYPNEKILNYLNEYNERRIYRSYRELDD